MKFLSLFFYLLLLIIIFFISKIDLFRKIIELGIIQYENLGQTTYFRYLREYDLLEKNIPESNKKRLAFAMQYANQLWQGDTMFGPYVKNSKGISTQTILIAFLDDASRVICHGQFFFNENIDSLMETLKKAFYKRGIPEQLYVDNGSIYCSQEITLVCARIGTILRHNPVREGAAKGKIERFFRTVRMKFLARNLNLASIDKLNQQFQQWVEQEYNAKTHSAISMKPIDRFNIDIKRIKFLEPIQTNDELFFAETTRKVKKDNTFSFNSIRYEAPADLRDKSISIRFDRNTKDQIMVYYKNIRIGEAKVLNLIVNGLIKR